MGRDGTFSRIRGENLKKTGGEANRGRYMGLVGRVMLCFIGFAATASLWLIATGFALALLLRACGIVSAGAQPRSGASIDPGAQQLRSRP
ncbi:hypothetical protein U1769_19615 [Sphingomonas sp. ZT3P38]|uniref:hypothetical protein n=1 Tax=Parasphingomonas zepuensis TaxID=3096161 RepID=UPI002FCC0B6E